MLVVNSNRPRATWYTLTNSPGAYAADRKRLPPRGKISEIQRNLRKATKQMSPVWGDWNVGVITGSECEGTGSGGLRVLCLKEPDSAFQPNALKLANGPETNPEVRPRGTMAKEGRKLLQL